MWENTWARKLRLKCKTPERPRSIQKIAGRFFSSNTWAIGQKQEEKPVTKKVTGSRSDRKATPQQRQGGFLNSTSNGDGTRKRKPSLSAQKGGELEPPAREEMREWDGEQPCIFGPQKGESETNDQGPENRGNQRS